MTRSFFRGHPTVYVDGKWLYEDTLEPSGFGGKVRPCKKCGAVFDGSNSGNADLCLGELPGVDNACCGHGEKSQAYIRFTNGKTVTGFDLAT